MITLPFSELTRAWAREMLEETDGKWCGWRDEQTPRERQILGAYVYPREVEVEHCSPQYRSLREIAEPFAVTVHRVRGMVLKAMEKLRRYETSAHALAADERRRG